MAPCLFWSPFEGDRRLFLEMLFGSFLNGVLPFHLWIAEVCSDLRTQRTFTASVCCSNGLKNTSQHLQWAQTQAPEVPPSPCASHTPFLLMDPNNSLGSHQANPGHLPKGKGFTSHCIKLLKKKKSKKKKGTKYASTSMYRMYTRTLPPHIHLCEQDSMLQKFIKIYNLPRTASILPIPCLELRLLYLYIKYTSPVKSLCWEHSGDFCTVRGCPGIALQWSEVQELCTKARAALHRPSLHCTGGIFGVWYSSRPPPGSAHSTAAQRSLSLRPEVTHPQLKASSRGIAAECKVATRFPFGIRLLQPSLEQSFPQGSRAAEFTHYSLSEVPLSGIPHCNSQIPAPELIFAPWGRDAKLLTLLSASPIPAEIQ